MKKISILLAGLALAGLASAQTNTLTNEGRIMSSTSVFAAANGAGGSLSHAQTATGATANGTIAIPQPGQLTLKGDVAGYSNLSAYNTSFGSGTGSADGRVWSDARVWGDLGTTIPSGSGVLAIDVEAGMRDAVRNGSDVTVRAGTAQDGFANAMYNGGAQASLAISAGPAWPGTSVFGNVQSSTYQHSEAVAGGVTFTGGAPANQTAATRFGQSGVQVDTSGSFTDPVGK